MASCVSETQMCVYVLGFLSFQNVKSTGRFYIFSKTVGFIFLMNWMKIPLAKPGEWSTICTRPTGFTLALASGRALNKNPDTTRTGRWDSVKDDHNRWKTVKVTTHERKKFGNLTGSTINSELADQPTLRALFTCVVYTKNRCRVVR